MSEKKSLYERIFSSSSKKADNNSAALEAQVNKKLKALVYDDEVVSELLPIFMKLHATEGFNTVYELLEAKEKQIEAISGGDWFKQESNPDRKDGDDKQQSDATDLVDEILKQQYSKEQ